MKKLFSFLTLWLCVVGIFAVVPVNFKRGVCLDKENVADITALSGGPVSWFYNWKTAPASAVESSYQGKGLEFVTMCWSLNHSTWQIDATSIRNYLLTHPNVKYILGFNEPQFTAQANLTPKQAADAWPQIQAIADEFGLKTVSPAMNYSPNSNWTSSFAAGENWVMGTGANAGQVDLSNPYNWLTEFFRLLKLQATPGKVDYIAAHCYMNDPGAVQSYIKGFKTRFPNTPIWLTEFCAWEGSVSSVTQKSYLKSMIAYLDAEPFVFRYAWFIGRNNPYTPGNSPNNDLVDNTGTLTALGKIYMGIEDQTILNSITLKIIDKTKGAVTNSAAWPDQSTYTYLAVKGVWSAISNNASSFAGMYSGLPGGSLVKTATEWTWSFTFEAEKGKTYAWNPGVFTNAARTENAFTKLAPFNINGGANLEFSTDPMGKATGILSVTFESATTITPLNTAETQQMKTAVITDIETVPFNESSVSIYPNPVNGIVHISCATEIQLVKVVNLAGVVVLQVDNASVLDLSGLENGVYLMDVQTIDNKHEIKKVLVQK